jgi:opacity protein-like surface antigen
MKKNLLVSLCLGTVFAVASQASASSCQINSGAYAGISAGVSTLTGSGEFTAKNSAGIFRDVSAPNKLSKSSAAAALFGGYAMKFGSFFTAAELFYQFDNLKNTNEFELISLNKDKKVETKSSGSYGAAVHLGFLPSNNCVLYAIAGLDVRQIKVKFSESASPIDIHATANKKCTSIAFAPGVGVRFSLTKNISLRTEYKYAMHRIKKLTGTATNPNGGADTVTMKSSPKVHSFNLGVVYSF